MILYRPVSAYVLTCLAIVLCHFILLSCENKVSDIVLAPLAVHTYSRINIGHDALITTHSNLHLLLKSKLSLKPWKGEESVRLDCVFR